MSINRRGALGAMIGGVAAAPEVAKQVAKLASDGGLQAAPIADMANEVMGKKFGLPPDKIAALKRIASGDFSDDDYDALSYLLPGYYPSKESGTDHDDDLAVLKSVSPQARRVLTQQRRYEEARRHMVKAAIAKLLSLGA